MWVHPRPPTVQFLTKGHWIALKEIGVDFLKGYTALAEGEKDPRNLLLAFSIDRVLLLEFDVKPYIEVSRPSWNMNLGLTIT